MIAFGANSPEMTTRLADPLSNANRDFEGLSNELYDVFYSNAEGTFNMDGEYITIDGIYTGPSSSGLNIGEVELFFSSSSIVISAPLSFPLNGGTFATVVTHHVPGATNFVPGNLNNIVDGNINTYTSMGVSSGNNRMSVTVGFADNDVPEPSSIALLGTGGLALIVLKRRHFRMS